jgi:hypothetical protein
MYTTTSPQKKQVLFLAEIFESFALSFSWDFGIFPTCADMGGGRALPVCLEDLYFS